MVVMSLLCLVQSAMLTGVFCWQVGVPDEGVLLPPVAELFVTTCFTSISAAAMGLFVSSLFTNPDRAMTVAPLLLMPQMLFSGLLFQLSGATEKISWFATCRWSMEGYGTTANLNALTKAVQELMPGMPHEPEDFFELTTGHMWKAWGIMAAFTVGFLILSRLILSGVKKEGSK